MGKRGNGEGSIRFNEARRRWEGRTTVGVNDAGQPVRRMVTARTRGEVAKLLREMRDAADSGRAPARRDLTVARFLDEWMDTVLVGSVAASTEVQYRDVVRLYVRPHLGRKHLTTLNARDVARMLVELEKEGRSPNTRRLA